MCDVSHGHSLHLGALGHVGGGAPYRRPRPASHWASLRLGCISVLFLPELSCMKFSTKVLARLTQSFNIVESSLPFIVLFLLIIAGSNGNASLVVVFQENITLLV